MNLLTDTLNYFFCDILLGYFLIFFKLVIQDSIIIFQGVGVIKLLSRKTEDRINYTNYWCNELVLSFFILVKVRTSENFNFNNIIAI